MGKHDKDLNECRFCDGWRQKEGYITTYFCDYSRDSKNTKSWLPYYKEQKRRRGEALSWKEQNEQARRDACKVDCDKYGPKSMKPALKPSGCQSDPCFIFLPEQYQEVLAEVQRQKDQEDQVQLEHQKSRTREITEENRTSKLLANPIDITSQHWSIQRQRQLDAEFQKNYEKYRRDYGNKNYDKFKGQSGEEARTEPLQQMKMPAFVLEPVPPGDIMEPRPVLLRAKEWKGVPLDTRDPKYEKLIPVTVDPQTMRCDLNPFSYAPRNKRGGNYRNPYAPITEEEAANHPVLVGHSSAIMETKMPDRRIPEKSHWGINTDLTNLW